MSRDYHRRRRDRVIFDLDQPEADIEINQRDGVPDQMTPNSDHKQELTNQNADAIFDPAHDRDLTSRSSDQTSVLSSVSEDSQSVEMMTSDGDESCQKSKPNLLPPWLRRLCQFRVTSSKREMPVNLVSYASTDDVQRSQEHRGSTDNRFVSRHESMTSRKDEKPSTITLTSRDQSDAAVVSQGRGLSRHSSDLTLAKSRRSDLSRDDEEPFIIMRSVTSGPMSHHDRNLGPVSTHREPLSVGTGHELVRHESLSRNEFKTHELVRYNSQPFIIKPGTGNTASSPNQQISKPRINVVPAVPPRDKLGPALTMSRHDNATSPLCQKLLPDRGKISCDWQPVRTKSTPQREVTAGSYKTRWGQDIVEPRNIQLTSRQISPPNNNSGRPRDGPRDVVALTTESPRRHSPMTSRPTGQVVTKTSATSTVQRSSPSINKGQTTSGQTTSGDQTTSGHHLAKSADQSRRPSSSSTSSDALHDVRRKPPPTMNKPQKPVSPANNQNLTQLPKPPSPSQSIQSSSSSVQDQARRKPPPTMNKPEKPLSLTTNQNQIPPPQSPSQTFKSLPTSTQDHARRNPAPTSNLSPQKLDQTNVTTYPVPMPRRNAGQTQEGLPQSFQSSASNNQQHARRKPPELSPQKPFQTTANTSTTYPLPSPRRNASQIPSAAPQTLSPENPDQIIVATVPRDLSRSHISPTGRSPTTSKSDEPVSTSKQTLGQNPSSPTQSSSLKIGEEVEPRSVMTSAKSSTVERNPIMNSIPAPQQTSNRPQSESVHQGSVPDHDNVDIAVTFQDTPLAKSPEFKYSEPPYGLREAPADDPDVLDKQSKTCLLYTSPSPRD